MTARVEEAPVATVLQSSRLAAPAEVVWDRLQRVDLLQEVAHPLLVMSVPRGTPAQWEQGASVPITSRLFGVVPIGTQTVHFEQIDHERHRAETNESGGLVRSWNHVMTLVDNEDGTCTYTDHVLLDAGPVTILVAAFARLLYWHRHRRWRRLAPLLT